MKSFKQIREAKDKKSTVYHIVTQLDEAVKTKVYKSGKYWLVDVTSSKIDYTDWGPTGRGFANEKDAQEFAKHIQKSVKESVELDEATDFRPGDTVHEVGSKLKGTVQHKGNRDLIAVKFGSVNQMIPASRLRLVESVELDEAMGPLSPQQIAKLKKEYGSIDKINVTGPAYKKVKAMIKNMDKEDLMTLAKAKVKWLSDFAASELRLTHNMKMKPSEYMESVELGEAKISVGDRVTLQPNKNTLDRSLIGKAGVVTGMLGSKPTVKFANGQTIVVSPKDLKINESSELDEVKNYEYKDGKVHISKANFRKVSRDYKNPTKGKERMVVLDPKTQGTVSAPVVFTEESFELGEAKKKIHSVSNGKLRADVIKLSGADDEGDPYIVKLFKNGKHYEPADYFTDDKNDAIGTAKMMVKENVELGESTYMVTIDKGTFGGVKSDGRPILVKAKSVRDATTKAAKKVKIDPRLVPTGGFNVKVNNKESVEHEDCGTPDCCGTCDTDIKEMNFFQFRDRLNEARKDASADLYFNTYSAAVQYAKAQAEKKGYKVDEDDWQDKVATGPRKPSKDKTVRHTLKLTKNGKPVRQGLSIQVYNRGSDKKPYELNFYVS